MDFCPSCVGILPHRRSTSGCRCAWPAAAKAQCWKRPKTRNAPHCRRTWESLEKRATSRCHWRWLRCNYTDMIYIIYIWCIYIYMIYMVFLYNIYIYIMNDWWLMMWCDMIWSTMFIWIVAHVVAYYEIRQHQILDCRLQLCISKCFMIGTQQIRQYS